MKSPNTGVYEQDSQMALSCFHYDTLLCKCLPMQKKSDLGDTVPENAQDSPTILFAQPFENYSKVSHYCIYCSEVQ